MKKMVSTMSILLMLILSIVTLIGCKKNKISVIVPNGTPLVAIAGLLDDVNIDFENVSGPDPLTAAMTSKSHDVVIAPITAGAKVYMAGASNYKLEAIITFSNTYIVSRKEDKLDSIEDLQGKEITAYAQANTPGIILRTALENNGVEADITYLASVSEVTSLFTANVGSNAPQYILVAEPQITTMIEKFSLELNILDLQEVLKDDVELICQAAIFVNPDSEYQGEITIFLENVKKNIQELNSSPAAYAGKVVDKNQYLQTLTKEIIEKSIPRSNIDYFNAKENKTKIEEYFNILNTSNSSLLGGNLPDEDFYR